MARVITTPRGGTRTLRYREFNPWPRVSDVRPDPDDIVLIHADQVFDAQESRKVPIRVPRGRWPPGFPPIPRGYAAWVDVYDSPHDGYGFVVMYEVERGAKLFRRMVNYGAADREQDWTEYIPLGPIGGQG